MSHFKRNNVDLKPEKLNFDNGKIYSPSYTEHCLQ